MLCVGPELVEELGAFGKLLLISVEELLTAAEQLLVGQSILYY